RRFPLGAPAEAVFALAGDTPAELLDGLRQLRHRLDGRPAADVARRWWHERRPDPAAWLGLALVARDVDELRQQLDFAESRLRDRPDAPIATRDDTGPVGALRDRVFYAPRPLAPAGRLAFVYPGSGNQFVGMGRRLGVTWP